MKFPLPTILLLLSWHASVMPALSAPDTVVTFNEVFYHPPDPVPPETAPAPEWLELHNQMSVRVDLGGWTVRGGISWQFPEGVVLEPGGYLILSAVAGNPPGSLGPFTGKLDNAGEEIRLHERHGRMMDTLSYGDHGDWPAAADGQGFSLAKFGPDTASGPAASWTASSQSGGTPGTVNFPGSVELPPRLLFGIGSTWKLFPDAGDPPAGWTGSGDFSDSQWISATAPLGTEGPQAPATVLPSTRKDWYLRKSFAWSGSLPHPQVLLTGNITGSFDCWLNGSRMASTTGPSGSGVAFAATTLQEGANLLAIRLSSTDSLASAWFDVAAAVVDGKTAVAPPPAPAPAGPVVFHEISYHPPPRYADPAAKIVYEENPSSWVELLNRSAAPVDLGGWSLADGIRYLFPPGTLLPPGGLLVVDQTQYQGSPARSGERLQLLNATGQLEDEVHYQDGPPWPAAADGGGSTLELRDARADRRNPEAWAASNEFSRTSWQTVTYRANGAEPPGSNNPSIWHEFLLGLLDEGEVLIDQVSVLEDPDGARVQLIQNGSFENDTPGGPAARWRLLGTHRNSRVELHPEGTGKVLRLVATAEAEHTYNTASTTLVGNRALSSAKTYEISYQARWLSGSPQLNSRLYLNRAAKTTILQQPTVQGTRGQPNSTALTNAGPTGVGLRHSPLVPAAAEPVRISLSLQDPDGIQSATLRYRLNLGAWQSVSMGGSAAGQWFGILPGQVVNSLVQFYVEATDGAGAVASFPKLGRDSRALYRVGDGGISSQPVRNKLRLLMNATDAASLHNPVHGVSNFRWPCTVLYNDREIWYDARVRLRSAPFGRQGNRAGWNIQFPSDHLFRGGQSSVVVDGAFNMPRGDGTGWVENSLGASVNELVYQAIANRAGGIPATYDDVIYFQTPRSAEGNRRAQLKMTRFNPSYLEEAFYNGADGTLFKQELIYYPTTTLDGNPESLKSPYNSVLDTEIRRFGSSKEGWRWNYLIQNNSRQDDYSAMMALGLAFDSPSTSLLANTSAILDARNWTRVFALTALTGLADTYNNGLAHNIQLYARPDGKVLLFPWDQDHSFYYSPTSSLFGAGTHRLSAILNLPPYRRMFAGHLRDLCQTAFLPQFVDPVINHLSSNAVAGKIEYAASLRNWIAARRNHVLNQIATQFPVVSFAITTSGGNNFATTQPSVTLAGTGWIDIDSISVSRNGAPAAAAPLTWTTDRIWNLTVPVTSGPNDFVLTALDHQGNPVGSDTISITNTGSVEPASATNLSIVEVHYHPAGTAAEEYVELLNTGNLPIDLTGVRFTAGIDFDFTASPVTILLPGQRILVVENRAAFTSRYGSTPIVAGEFLNGTNLANSGEELILVDRANAVISAFSYADAAPWPEEADGQGRSLIRIRPDSLQNPALPIHWRPSAAEGGSPGTSDIVLLPAYPNALAYALTELPSVSPGPDGNPVLTWAERLGADDVRVLLEVSADLQTWTMDPRDGSGLPLPAIRSEGGSRIFRIPFSSPAPPARYVRLKVVPR